MKKTFIIATALCASMAANCLAQEPTKKPSDDREKFQLGIKAGANYTGLFDAHAHTFNYDTKFCFAGGIYGTASISKYLGLQLEVLYSQRQIEADGNLPKDMSGAPLNTEYVLKRKVSYIDIPFYVQLKEGEHLVFVAGPSVSFIVNREDKLTFTGGDAGKAQAIFDAQVMRTPTFGFGGGVDYRISRFVIGVRGYRDLFSTNENSNILAPYYKNKMLQISLGFKLI
jgi:hypothetical protein